MRNTTQIVLRGRDTQGLTNGKFLTITHEVDDDNMQSQEIRIAISSENTSTIFEISNERDYNSLIKALKNITT